MASSFSWKGVAVSAMNLQQAQAALNEVLAQIEAGKAFAVSVNITPGAT